ALKSDDGKTVGDEIIFLTDGEASDNVQDCFQEAVQSGAIIHTIAFGPKADNVLKSMADKTGGKFRVAQDSQTSQLVDAFSSMTLFDGNPSTLPIQHESTGKLVTDWFNGTIPIDRTSGKHTTFVLIYKKSAPTVYIHSPSGLVYDQRNSTDTANTITLTVPAIAEPGDWKYSFCNREAAAQEMSLTVMSRAAREDVPPVTVTARMSQQLSDEITTMIVLADVSQNYNPVLGVSVWAYLESDNGQTEKLQLLDNGAGADASKYDGVLSKYFINYKRGRYSLKVRVERKEEEMHFPLHRQSSALYVPGYITDGKVELNPPKPPVNVQTENIGSFTRVATGESFVVEQDAPSNFPPNKITDLTAVIQEETVFLRWTAPGEDCDEGTAQSYEIRWSKDLKMLQHNFKSTNLVNTSELLPKKALGPVISIRLEENGYTDILIVISPAVPENEELLHQIKEMLISGSEYLFEALNHKLFIKEVKILVPPNWTTGKYERAGRESFNKGRIRIDSPHPHFGDEPYTHQPGDCGKEAEYIHFTPNFLLKKSFINPYGPRGKVFLHEWAHLRWGVFDEYNTQEPFYMSGGQIQATRCTDTISGKFYEIINQVARPCQTDEDGKPTSSCVFIPDKVQNTSASIMYIQSITSVKAFCQEEEHNYEAPNEQNKKCAKATSTVIFQDSVDKDALLILKPLPSKPSAPNFKVIQRGRRAVCLILDVSGSMSGSRIKLQQQVAKLFLSQIIDEQQYVALVTFSSEAQILSNLTLIDGPASRASLINKLPTTADGLTYICKGLRKGFEALQISHGETKGKEIIFLTDGEATDNVQDCFQEAVKSGAIIHTIAFGPSADKVLKTMAEQTEGEFRVARETISSNELVDAFSSMTMSDGDPITQPVQHESTGKNVADWFNGTVPIDRTAGKHTTFTLIYERSAPAVYIQSPNGLVYDQRNTTDSANTITLTVLGRAEPGDWKYSFLNRETAAQQMSLTVMSRVAGEDLHPVTVTAQMSQQLSDSTKPMVVWAEITQNYVPVLGVSVWAILESNTGHSEKLELLDNGEGADVFKDDGVYSRYFMKFKLGRYSLKVKVESQHEGDQFNLHKHSSALYVPGYIVDGKVELNPPKPPVNVQKQDIGRFTRVVTAKSFVVAKDAPSNFPPNKIKDLTAAIREDTVFLNWTAPGEDCDQGTAQSYEIRWSKDFKMLQNNFSSSNLFNTSALQPQESGSAEQHSFQLNSTIKNDTMLFFAVLSLDKQSAKSEISNIAHATKYGTGDLYKVAPLVTQSNLLYGFSFPDMTTAIWTYSALVPVTTIRLDGNGYTDILIAISPAVPENEELLHQIKEMFISGSEYLFEALDHKVFFKEVKILVPPTWTTGKYERARTESFSKGRIRIDSPHSVFGDEPFTHQTEGCGKEAEYIHFTPNFFLNNSFTIPYGPRDGPASRASLIHKLPTTASGFTYICKALRKGLEALKSDDGKTVGDEIIFLTDGEATDNVQDCFQEAVQSGAIIHTIAFGPNATNVLIAMANQTGGNFRVAQDSQSFNQLVNAFYSMTLYNGNPTTQPIQLESTGMLVTDWFNGTVSIDRTVGNRTTFTLIFKSSAPNMYIQSPSGLVYDQRNTTDTANTITLTVPGTVEPGDWKYSFFNRETASQQMSLIVMSRAAHKDVAPVTVTVRMNQQISDGSKPMVVMAEVSQSYNAVLQVRVSVNLESHTGHSEKMELFDNGAGTDAFKDDGVYSRYFTKIKRGRYSLSVRVENQDAGVQFSSHRYSSALYVPGYIADGKVVLNTPKPPVNVQIENIGRFTRTATGESFVVEKDASSNFPPNKITDLIAEIHNDTVFLSWTAPGEDYDQGTAQAYEIRWSEKLKLLQNNFESSNLFNTSTLLPQESGSAERHYFKLDITIENRTTVFFAVQSMDQQLAKSEVSNIARATNALGPVTTIRLDGNGYTDILIVISPAVPENEELINKIK
ncbi:epithelial chloride channel protein-like, partial [Clarias magur]